MIIHLYIMINCNLQNRNDSRIHLLSANNKIFLRHTSPKPQTKKMRKKKITDILMFSSFSLRFLQTQSSSNSNPPPPPAVINSNPACCYKQQPPHAVINSHIFEIIPILIRNIIHTMQRLLELNILRTIFTVYVRS